MPLKPLKENPSQADIIEWIKETTVQFDTTEAELVKTKKELTETQTDNQRLFIQAQAVAVGKVEDKQPDTKELEEYIGKDVLKVLSTKEIEKAKQIMEGEDE